MHDLTFDILSRAVSLKPNEGALQGLLAVMQEEEAATVAAVDMLKDVSCSLRFVSHAWKLDKRDSLLR